MISNEKSSYIYLNKRGLKFIKENKPYEAITSFKKALSMKVKPEFYYNLALAEEITGNDKGSTRYLHKIFELNNNSLEARNGLKIIHTQELKRERHKKQDREDKSYGTYETCLQILKYCKYKMNLNPKSSKNYNLLGMIYDAMNIPHMAIRSYKKAISLNDNIAEYYYDLARAEYHVMEYNNCALHVEKAIQLNPRAEYYKLATAYNLLGITNKARKNTKEALKDYKKAISLNSKKSIYFYNLASLEFHLKDVSHSFENIKKALKLDPIDSSYDRLSKKIKSKVSKEKKNSGDSFVTDLAKDFNNSNSNNYNPNINYSKKLNDLIGLTKIKSLITYHVDQVIFHKIRTGEHNHGQMHFVFEGNPGTGKTTVANLLCNILYQRHITTSKQCVEVNATQLVSKYLGDTKNKIHNAIKKAMGGVLFIDEAYYLAHRTDGNSICQDEALDELIPDIEKYNNNLVVIMAGYTKHMEHFLNHSNPGLMSRFPVKDRIYFPNYSNKECMEILHLYLKKNHLILGSTKTKSLLERRLSNLLNVQRKRAKNTFSNARYIRNIYENLDINFSRRIMHKYTEGKVRKFKAENNPIINTINSEDVNSTLNYIQKVEDKHYKSKDSSHSIGFK